MSFQGNTTPDLVKPMIASIKELWDCSDELLQCRANYIMVAMAGEKDVTGDCTERLLETFLSGKSTNIGSKTIQPSR